MSEYQYYEFQAIDRPLTQEEQEAVARLSSRVDPHPRRAVFTYSWSDFPGNPQEILARYYDAMLYMANWGSIQLMFRFPRSALDLESVQAYCQPCGIQEFFSFSTVGEYMILDISLYEDGGGDWIDAEGWLDVLLPLRDDILRGDYRMLYLAWLKAIEMEDVLDSVIEPPVPSGLTKLTPALGRFRALFEINKRLLEVAAEASPIRSAASDDWIRAAIARLPRAECDTFLHRLTQGEPHLGLALKARLREIAGRPKAQSADAPRRTVGDLVAETQRRRKLERRRQAEKAERARVKRLETLAARETEIWAEVDALIQQTKAKAYEEAARHLLDLRELAEYKSQTAAFQQRLAQLRALYNRRSALLRSMNEAGL